MSGYSWVSLGVPDVSDAQRQGVHVHSNLRLLLPYTTRWLVYRHGSEAHENFAPLSFSDYDHQRISITNCQSGRSERHKHLLHEAGVSVDTPDGATASRKAKAPVMPASPTERRLLRHSHSGSNTASHSSAFVMASPPCTIDPTPISSVVTWSQPEQTEFAVPPPCPLSRARDFFQNRRRTNFDQLHLRRSTL